MRLLNRLNQYQRLWQPSAGKPQTVTVSELAERCFCSERHVRTLLRQAQEAGWLEWQAQYSAAIFLIPICISFDTAEKRRYATYLILNRRFSFEF